MLHIHTAPQVEAVILEVLSTHRLGLVIVEREPSTDGVATNGHTPLTPAPQLTMREHIMNALASAGTALTTREIATKVSGWRPDTKMTTIYNTLRLLAQSKQIGHLADGRWGRIPTHN